MIETRGYATQSPTSKLTPFSFSRRGVGYNDILIQIQYCGVCHSDIHQARDEWGGSIYPMVPGHEIVGKVTKVGSGVRKFRVGDIAGVGCFVDSCRECANCKAGEEQFCDGHLTLTYNGKEKDQKTPTYGGYSSHLVVDEKYGLKVPANLHPAAVAPLLCAGITTFSPLRHFDVGKMHRVGVMGLGGLGHMAVKFAAAFGAEVTVLSTSRDKQADAKRLGAQHFVATKEDGALEKLKSSFDFLVNTVSAPHNINDYLQTLRLNGTMIVVGVPPKGTQLDAFSLLMKRRRIAGSIIGGIKQTQEMLDFCSTKEIVSDIEQIPMHGINEAYERMMKNDVRYRFVIDMKTI